MIHRRALLSIKLLYQLSVLVTMAKLQVRHFPVLSSALLMTNSAVLQSE